MLLEADPQCKVVGKAFTGKDAVEMAEKLRPDVITMDIVMPGMDGFDATRSIMASSPRPIVIVSSNWDPDQVELTFKAIEAGAVTCLRKPAGPGNPSHEAEVAALVATVKSMSEVRVVTRKRKAAGARATSAADPPADPAWMEPEQRRIDLVGIGASTGGPAVLKVILSGLSAGFSLPIVIVQHIAQGFVHGMVEWLSVTTSRRVEVARQGVVPAGGTVYVAPDDCHLAIDSLGRLDLVSSVPVNNVRPSVSVLFDSLARRSGAGAVGVLLTGMGVDGAQELKAMRDAGALTVVQDRESSVVWGMPGTAAQIGGAAHVMAPEKIAAFLNGLSASRPR